MASYYYFSDGELSCNKPRIMDRVMRQVKTKPIPVQIPIPEEHPIPLSEKVLPPTRGFLRGLNLGSLDMKLRKMRFAIRREDTLCLLCPAHEFPSLKFVNEYCKYFSMFCMEYKENTPLEIEALKIFLKFLRDTEPRLLPRFIEAWTTLIISKGFVARYLQDEILELEEAYCGVVDFYLQYLHSAFMATEEEAAKNEALIKTIERGYVVLKTIVGMYPNFICRFSMRILDQIPHFRIRIRNLIMSCAPYGFTHSDPLNPACIIPVARIHQKYEMVDTSEHYYKQAIPGYLKLRLKTFLHPNIDTKVLNELGVFLINPKKSEKSAVWIEYRIRALVYYLGYDHMASHSAKAWGCIEDLTLGELEDTKHLTLLHYLVCTLDRRGRSMLFRAIFDRLQYPCFQTYYYHKVALHLFFRSTVKEYKEEFMTTMLRRMLCEDPHPYGLGLTLRKLHENPKFEYGKTMVLENVVLNQYLEDIFNDFSMT